MLLRPNLIILPVSGASYADEVAKKLPGIPVIVMSATTRQDGIPELKILGQILGKEEQANKLINWTEKYADIVEERTKNLKPEEMPTFYYEYMSESSKWQAIPPSNPAGMVVEGCGGKNLAADLEAERLRCSGGCRMGLVQESGFHLHGSHEGIRQRPRKD